MKPGPGVIFTKGLGQVVGLTFVFKKSQLELRFV